MTAATDGSSVLNLERVRSCSKKARSYMKLYLAFSELSEEEHSAITDKYSVMEGAIKKYSRMKKKSKTHRSVMDMNGDDILEIERSIPLHRNRNYKSEKDTHIKVEMIGKLVNKMNSM